MTVQRYRIYELSARAVMSYATEENGIYKYDLDASAVDHCLVSSAAHEQDSNALFFQILSELHGGRYRETVTEDVSEALNVCFGLKASRWTSVTALTVTLPLNAPAV